MNLWLVLLFIAFSLFPSIAASNSWTDLLLDSTFTCNNLVQISLDENCEAWLQPDMILEGYQGPESDMQLEVLDEVGLIVPMPITGNQMSDSLYLIVTHQPTGQSCWGRAVVEDKWAPQITCNNYTVSCFESISNFPKPQIWDNCDAAPELNKLSEVIDDSDKCTQVLITQTFQAVDQSGNLSNICQQFIEVLPPDLPVFPKDTTWTCQEYLSYPSIIDAKKIKPSLFSTGSGIPDVANGDLCPYNVVHSDFVFTTDCAETFTIMRTWTVLNWCTDEIITIDSFGNDHVQLIKIIDHEAPTIARSPFTVNANLGAGLNEICASTDFLMPPTNIGDCYDVTVRILTGIGEAIYIGQDGKSGGYIPSPGLPLGTHTIVYEAQDACGNTDTIQVKIKVADQTAPTPVCDELTNVSLGIEGLTKVAASVLDDGSTDNCCLDSLSVRRMIPSCSPADSLFQDSVLLCCSDVGDTVQVILRATDCSGNHNDCMVLIEVEEKLPPVLVSCPGAQVIDCEFYTNFLELALSEGNDSVLLQFGEPVFEDNCGVHYLENEVVIDIDQCQQGTITRNWKATDSGANLTLTCTQQINVEHYSDWVVAFPEDVLIDCGETFPDTGEPTIFYENCELVAISYSDQVFNVVPDVCYKITRTWTAINWCIVGDEIDNPVIESPESILQFDLNYDQFLSPYVFQDGVNSTNFNLQSSQYGAQADGVVIYQQEIGVIDQVAPVVDCSPTLEVCINGPVCYTDVLLPTPDIQDCGIEITTSAFGDLGIGLGPFINVPPGLYAMTYQVDDNCGNTSFCETAVLVKDCKPPTPVCQDALIIEIEQDSVTVVLADIFDEGSFDNCPGDLSVSFSADPSDSTAVFTCATLGFRTVNIWFTDASGNQAFCETVVFVQDNEGVCVGLPLIAGTVTQANNQALNQVKILINNGLKETLTDSSGFFNMVLTANEDYSITPVNNEDPLNGITTYDIVLISKHILGISPLSNPFQIIAADANLSNSVTTADIVAIRKLILQVNTELPFGKSWRFIDADYTFPNVLNPFKEPLPELINVNNLSTDALENDFIGVKIGDVNFSAN